MNRKHLAAFCVGLCLVAHQPLCQAQDKPSGLPPAREKYDPSRDPAKDVAAAVALASKSGKRILLDVGGEWCPWCRKLDKCFAENEKIAAFLRTNFIVVKVNFSQEDQNKGFLSQYPAISGYPFLFVLDSAGKLLESQSTGELESGDHHDPGKVLDFLRKWAPTRRGL